MKSRLEAARRVQAIQEQMRRLAEWQKEEIDRQARAAQAEQQAIIESFNGDDDPLAGLFVDVMARRLQRVALEMRLLEARSAEQTQRILTETAREKQAGKLATRLAGEERRRAEDRSLAEIVDAGEARRHASLE